MADEKLTQLTEDTSPALTDLIYGVKNPGGTPLSRKLTWTTVFNLLKTATLTFTNKRNTKRTVTVTQSATPAINTDNTDVASITGLAQAITSLTTNLTGTPSANDMLLIEFTDNGTARAITHGSSFVSTSGATMATTTVANKKLMELFKWSSALSKWECVSVTSSL
jgi:hypothetical protein